MGETHHARKDANVCNGSLLVPRMQLLKADQDAVCEATVADAPVRGRGGADKQWLTVLVAFVQMQHKGNLMSLV